MNLPGKAEAIINLLPESVRGEVAKAILSACPGVDVLSPAPEIRASVNIHSVERIGPGGERYLLKSVSIVTHSCRWAKKQN